MFTIEALSAYTRFPDRLKDDLPELEGLEKPDVFGTEDRLLALRSVWPSTVAGRGKAIDLGGNSGYFSLSLVDEGLLSSATVFDNNADALKAGEQMASMMGLSDKVRFVRQDISLEWLRGLDPVDTVINLNLLHHAGALFDIDEVRRRGWGSYASDWLAETRRLGSGRGVFGIGFKGGKPPNWNVPTSVRPRAFLEMATSSGWNLVYDANVQDIADFGIERANGLRIATLAEHEKLDETAWAKATARVKRKFSKRKAGTGSKRNRYHLFVFD